MADETRFLAENFVFVAGHVQSRRRMAFVAHAREGLANGVGIAQLLFFEDDTTWLNGGTFQWEAIGITRLDEAGGSVVVVGRDGDVALWTPSGVIRERIRIPGRTVGPLRGTRHVDGCVFAYGMGRELYRRMDDGSWVAWEDGFPPKPAADSVTAQIRSNIRHLGGINAVDGISRHDLYAVGFRGEIYHSGGSRWDALASPTNVVLYDVAVTPSGEVFACGQRGTVLRVSPSQCQLLQYEGPQNIDLLKTCWFHDALYFADGNSLRVLRGGTMSMLDLGMSDGIPPSSSLHAADGVLLSVAGGEIYKTFDGQHWTAILN
jgi:hypothetical protein